VAPARLATPAGAFRGAMTTPARPAPDPVTGGRPSQAAAPLPPVMTAKIAGGGGHGRHADSRDGRAWPAVGPGDGRGHTATGRDGPVWTADGGQGHGADACNDRCWGPGHRRGDGGYPTTAANLAAGPHPARWDVGYDLDGPATAPLKLGVTSPVVTPIPGQPDVARDWWSSASWTPPTPATATKWRDSLTSGPVVALYAYDPSVNWAAVGPREVTAAVVQDARIGLAGVVPPCLESSRTRAKRFHAALRRVLRATGRPVHMWEYRCHDRWLRPSPVGTVLAPTR